jgi:hypothetical protein
MTKGKKNSWDHEEECLRRFGTRFYCLELLRGVPVDALTASSVLHSVACHSGAHILEASVRGTDDDLGAWASVNIPGDLFALIPAPQTANQV